MKEHYESYAVSRTWSSFEKTVRSDETHWEGNVYTSSGIVVVYAFYYDGDRAEPSTMWRCILDGRVHYLTRHERFTPRGMATIAGRFIREVCNG